MSRPQFGWLSLLLFMLVACQPIRPESELTPMHTPSSRNPSITNAAASTATSPLTTTVASTPADQQQAASTSASGADKVARGCPAIDPTQMDAPLDIAVLANWDVGEERAYLFRQRRVETEDGVAAVTLASTTPVTITVVSSDDDGYVLEWHYGQSELAETDVAIPDPVASLFQSPLQVHFQYSVDEAGAYVGLLDIEDLRAQIEPLFEQLFAALAASEEEPNPAALEAAQGMVARLLDDPANFEALFTGEVQLLHTVFGDTFDTAAPQVTTDLRPNMLGGAPIPSELTITPTHYDAGRGCLHVSFENIADPIAARNSILEALQEQARLMGVPGLTDADLPAELGLVDTMYFEIDLGSGWPTAISVERAIAVANFGRIESAEIILVTPDSQE